MAARGRPGAENTGGYEEKGTVVPPVLAGRYRLERVIGEGEMAMVYRAVDLHLDRPVAIKLLRERYASQPRFVERFLQEARAAGGLSHPNVVSIFDVASEDGFHFIVMEYVDGSTLKQILREGPQETDRVLRLGIQLAEVLHWAHGRGVVHRDVKPQNILVDRGDRVRLADFGISLAFGAATDASPDSIVGTPEYLSPEQLQGKPATPASDVYSAGVVLYEMLAGRPPFSAEDRSLIPQKHLHEPPPPLHALNPSVPESMEKIVLRALAKDPKNRFRSAGDLAAELQHLRTVSQQPTSMDSTTIPVRTQRKARTLRKVVEAITGPLAASLLVVAGALALLLLVLVSLIQSTADLRSASAEATAMAISANSTVQSIQSTARAAEALVTRSALDLSLASTAQAQAAATALPLQKTATALDALSTVVAREAAPVLTAGPVYATSVALLTSVQEPLQQPDGRLEHQKSAVSKAVIGRGGLFEPPFPMRNFVATVKFSNPYDRSEGAWDYGLGFRCKTANDGYRIFLDSSGRWHLQLASSNGGKPTLDDLASGQLGSVRLDRAGSNDLTVLVKDRLCLFYVNGNFVASLDVSNQDAAGELWIGTGFVLGNTLPGRATEFQGFKAWALP